MNHIWFEIPKPINFDMDSQSREPIPESKAEADWDKDKKLTISEQILVSSFDLHCLHRQDMMQAEPADVESSILTNDIDCVILSLLLPATYH